MKKNGGSSPTREEGKGLDVGTAFICCAEKETGKISFRTQRDAFFDVEKGDFTKKMLTKSHVNYIQKEDKLYVVGNEAVEFANIFHKNARRPLRTGIISPTEKEALPMIELIVHSVVGTPSRKGEIVYYSVPGSPADAKFNPTYHENIVKGFLTRAGYTAKPINEGMAIVFSELEKDDFSGIALSFGAGMVNVCLSFMSVPVVTFSLSKGGDWIDQQVAEAIGETASRVCAVKEAGLDLLKKGSQSKIETALVIYYNNLIEYVLTHIKRAFERSEDMPRIENPLNLVISGGSSLPKGFLGLFNENFTKVKFPVKIGQVRIASSPLYSVARGALIAALSDEER